MHRGTFVYVAGPYSHPDPVENTNTAVLVGNQLVDLGFVPYIPHLSLFWHAITPKPYQFWLDYDIEWLKKCDIVLRIPGESSGADKETELAKKLSIPVVHSLEELRALIAVEDGVIG